jgi:hypothetical protein
MDVLFYLYNSGYKLFIISFLLKQITYYETNT